MSQAPGSKASSANPSFPKVDTPPFFEQGGVDALLGMIMALGAEISALSERLETVVDLLDVHALVPAGEVEDFTPTTEQQARRDANRKMIVETLLAPLQLQAEALADQAVRRRSD